MASEQVRIIDRYREVVNFVYWLQRCEVEQMDETVAARKLVLEADEAFKDARFEEARDKYEQAWDKWANILDEYDILIDDVEGEILYEAVERYRRVLGQLDEPFPPAGFKLMRLVKEETIQKRLRQTTLPSSRCPPTTLQSSRHPPTTRRVLRRSRLRGNDVGLKTPVRTKATG